MKDLLRQCRFLSPVGTQILLLLSQKRCQSVATERKREAHAYISEKKRCQIRIIFEINKLNWKQIPGQKKNVGKLTIKIT